MDQGLERYATPRQREYLEAIAEHGTQARAAAALGIAKRTIERGLAKLRRSAARQGYSPEHGLVYPAPEGVGWQGASVYHKATKTTPAQWVKYKAEQVQQQELMSRLVERLCEEAHGVAEPVEPPGLCQDKLMAAYVVGDAHLGMRAHQSETGEEDYDTDRAVADLRGAFRQLVPSAPRARVGVLVNVGDFFHANDPTGRTPTSGHLLDTDGSFWDVVDRAVELFRECVALMLRKHQEVWIVNACGNHDPDAAKWLSKILQAYYHNEPRIKVLDNRSGFIYWTWGRVLIGTHHGDRITRQRLYEAMTRDMRQEWGMARWVYFWTGHVHHKHAEEIGGCLFESFNSMTARDGWHSWMGYGANRETQQITIHQDLGIVGRNICGLEMARLAA